MTNTIKWDKPCYKCLSHLCDLSCKEALAQPEYDYKDLYEKEKRKSAMWLAKYEEVAGPAPKAIPMTEPEQEPVAWVVYSSAENDIVWADKGKRLKQNTPLYTTTPQRTWVGLTDEEVKKIAYNTAERKVAKDIEAKLKEKNDC